MRVTYLGHSGFMAETDKAIYIFDYIRGELPALTKEKPLYIFASHVHEDHFYPIIFESGLPDRADAYIMGTDIKKKWKRRRDIIPEQAAGKTLWAVPGEQIELPGILITSLKSTDQGAAFIIEEKDGAKLYHAGDLNWWHWEGEALAWNRNMEVDYKREIDRMSGMHFDVAFVPLDPRLDYAYCYGMNYFLEKADADHIFPMHFWGQYDIISKYKKEYGHDIMTIEREGQTYEI